MQINKNTLQSFLENTRDSYSFSLISSEQNFDENNSNITRLRNNIEDLDAKTTHVLRDLTATKVDIPRLICCLSEAQNGLERCFADASVLHTLSTRSDSNAHKYAQAYISQLRDIKTLLDERLGALSTELKFQRSTA